MISRLLLRSVILLCVCLSGCQTWPTALENEGWQLISPDGYCASVSFFYKRYPELKNGKTPDDILKVLKEETPDLEIKSMYYFGLESISNSAANVNKEQEMKKLDILKNKMDALVFVSKSRPSVPDYFIVKKYVCRKLFLEVRQGYR